MKNKKLHHMEVQSINVILGRLEQVRENRKYNPGYLVDRNNINRAILELEDLLSRYKEAE